MTLSPPALSWMKRIVMVWLLAYRLVYRLSFFWLIFDGKAGLLPCLIVGRHQQSMEGG